MTNNGSAQLVQKLWNYCNVLRDDGLCYGDYLQQLTNLLFLKMAHERTLPPFNRRSIVPAGYDWTSLLDRDGDDLEVHYRHLLEELGKKPGMLGVIFRKAQNKIENPSMLRRLIVDLIDKEQWTTLDTDVKGDVYEGLLEKNAQDTKSGAGQYFTPRALIRAMVDVMRPEPGQTICDPAAGTGGFLLSAYDYISHYYSLDRDEKRHLKFDALQGWEVVPNTARLCAMNFLLHEIGGDECPLRVEDALAGDPGTRSESIGEMLTCRSITAYARPEAFLDPGVRRSQSAWSFVAEADQLRFVEALTNDLKSGAWEKRYGVWRRQPCFEGSLRLIVSHSEGRQ